jgi:phosphopantothenoylcysteine synthetase/decarboxylase
MKQIKQNEVKTEAWDAEIEGIMEQVKLSMKIIVVATAQICNSAWRKSHLQCR